MSRVKHEHEYEYTYEDRVRDDKRENKIRHEEYETKNYGTVTYQRDPRDSLGDYLNLYHNCCFTRIYGKKP